ncbi:hypothetical protein [Halomarina rubra]|uniref:Alpha-L-arabinofuranosidase 1 catalytic domain-containing protein n=1 Tax=Halomarina rubra TaxID=2071873 RepID=A0ABD6AQX8_9EURY|nr:hypothetical protein [Halomarina rubra]
MPDRSRRHDRPSGANRRVATDGGTTDDETVITFADDGGGSPTVSPGLLGKFTEMNGREGYPGLYSEHLANGSFEEWYTWPKRTPDDDPRWWRRSEIVDREADSVAGVAYPWQPIRSDDTRVTFEHEVGGVHGRHDDCHREDVHGRQYREPPGRYQRVTLWSGAAGVRQRLALPDRRTPEYDLSVSVRGTGLDGTVTVALTGADGDVRSETTLTFDSTPAGGADGNGEWERHETTLELPEAGSARYGDDSSAFGAYDLLFTVEGSGHLDVDWARLIASDAVDGAFNPTTVDTVRDLSIPCIRWPGGNFVSQYHWRDGIGPLEDRPVRAELHWGGLEPNYLGVAEFLTFCEHAETEPYLNVGFSPEITPEEAADMVEYVNGSTDTEMGALRAEHGYEEPWGVETWQVGNEVWGTFQIGHTGPREYAERYVEYYEAMKRVDPSITVFAVGGDPGNGHWEGTQWNETLFDIAGDAVEGIDVHRYVHGEHTGQEPVEFNQQLVAYPSQFERRLAQCVEQAEAVGIDDLQLTVGEWNMGAGGLSEGRRARYGTQAHAAFCAGMYNAFLRQGVKYAHMRDNAFKHRPFPDDFRPPHAANNATHRLYAEVFDDDRAWSVVPVDVTGPTTTLDQHRRGDPPAETIAPETVPLVDSAAVRSAHEAVIFLVNRDLSESRTVTVALGAPDESVDITVQSATDPLDDHTDWDGTHSYDLEDRTTSTGEDGTVTVTLGPAAVGRLRIQDR